MYGKVMSIPDSAMGDYFRLVTRWTPKQIESLEKGMASEKQNPRDVKMQLAREIVSIYHGADTVEDAEKAFRKVFQDGGVPEEIPALEVPKRQPLVDLMKESGLARSKSEARRLIQQRGVRLNDKVVEDIHAVITPGGASILQVGKRRFRRLSGELE
jgi:tyrosyl-tRNA synthetase